jgi:hypothetical protein
VLLSLFRSSAVGRRPTNDLPSNLLASSSFLLTSPTGLRCCCAVAVAAEGAEAATTGARTAAAGCCSVAEVVLCAAPIVCFASRCGPGRLFLSSFPLCCCCSFTQATIKLRCLSLCERVALEKRGENAKASEKKRKEASERTKGKESSCCETDSFCFFALLPLSTFINHFYPFQNYLSFPFPPPALWPCPEGGGRDLREKESSIRISPSLPLALSHFEKFLKKLKTSKKNSKNPENLFPAAALSAPSLGPPSSPRPAPSSPRAPSSSTSSPRTRTSTAATGGTAPTSPRCCESSPTSRACAGSGCFIATLRTSPRS